MLKGGKRRRRARVTGARRRGEKALSEGEWERVRTHLRFSP